MEPNKPVDPPELHSEEYTPAQRVIVKILQLGAWTAAFAAMTAIMHA